MVNNIGGIAATTPLFGKSPVSKKSPVRLAGTPQSSSASRSAGANLFDGGLVSIPLMCGICCCGPVLIGLAALTKTGRFLIKAPFKIIGGAIKLVTKPKEALGDIWEGIKSIPGMIKGLFTKKAAE